MANTATRTVKRLLLGREIEHMIGQAGVTQSHAATLIETNQTRINQLISGAATITVGDLERLARKLGVTDDGYVETLLELRRDNHKRGFWSTGYNRAYDEDFRLMVDMENHADLMRTVAVELMPGLLQCEAYVRALYAGAEERQDGVTVAERITARLERQKILFKDNAPDYRVVMSESCLDREFGGPEVMLEQMSHLLDRSSSSNVMLQVMPYKLRAKRVMMSNPFILVRVPTTGVAGALEMAYVEGEGDIRYLDDAKALAAHDRSWARLTDAALNTGDTRKFLNYKMNVIKDELRQTSRNRTRT